MLVELFLAWRLVMAFGLGLMVGSFLNVVIFRSVRFYQSTDQKKEKLDVVFARSACRTCGKVLRWWELVPVVSFVWQRGRCTRCGQRLSWQYPIIELLMGGLAVVVAAHVVPTPLGLTTALVTIAIISCLVVLALIDWHTMLLPDRYVVILLVFVAVFLVLQHADPLSAGRGVVLGVGFIGGLWILTRGRGIGLGDVKIMVPLGALLGGIGTIALLYIAFSLGGMIGLGLLLSRQVNLKTPVPFGPLLVATAVLLMLVPALPAIVWWWMWGN